MSLKDALSSVKLKPSKTKESKSQRVVFCEDSESYHKLMQETYFETYFEAIAHLTFKSEIIEMETDAIRELRDSRSATGSAMQKVAEQIDSAIATPRVFVRLSSRSPKDAAVLRPEFPMLMREAMAARGPPPLDFNSKLHALYVASTLALAVSSGREACELLAKSDRIRGDLDSVLEAREQGKACPFSVVIREFAEDIDVSMEFRAFIYNRKLTAITQYNNFVYFPNVVARREELLRTLTDFVSLQVLPAITRLDHFVLDLIVFNTPTPTVRVCEVNPLAEFAGSGLFSWVDDGDVDVLLGKKPFEFRVLEKVNERAALDVAPEWLDVLKSFD